MCHFEVDKGEFFRLFGIEFDRHFSKEIGKLKSEALIERDDPEKLVPTEMGRLMIRIVASAFDAYLERGQFSKAI